MPRMLTLWLDLGDTKDAKKYVGCYLGCIERYDADLAYICSH